MTIEEAIKWVQEYRTLISKKNKEAMDAIDLATAALNVLQKQDNNKSFFVGFNVIDVETEDYPDLQYIVLHEEWAKGLCYCDIDGFCISEDGTLVLMDDCGRCAYPPDGRFKVVTDVKVASTEEIVRCKDCRYYMAEGLRCDHPNLEFDVECYDQWLVMDKDDFCSYGERKK